MDVMRAAAAAASAGSFLDKAHLNAPHLLLPPFPRDRNTLHVLCSSHPLVDASNTPSPFHAHRIAPADAKTLYLLRKKEAWKARRRERKEKEKSERVTDPLWYEISEKEVSIKREKFRILDARGDYADEFLCHMRDQRPAQRIVMDGNDVIMPVLSKRKISRMRRSRVASKKPTAVTESLVASFVHDAGNTPMKTRNNEDFNVPAVDESGRLNPLCDDDLNPKHQSQRIAYTERSEFSAALGKARFTKETILHINPRGETAPCIDWSPSPSHSSPSIAFTTSFNGNRNLNTNAKIQASLGNDIKSFSDDEVLKIAEMWKKGVGIVKFRKFLISKEETERINARKRGNWNVLSEFTEDEDVYNETVLSPRFDGKAALLEDKKIHKLAARLNDIDYWTSKF